MTAYLYRRGDGNEGNFIRALVEIAPGEDPYAALKALLANDYIAGKRVRRHIIKHVQIDGEADYGIHATVYEGPEGEQSFGAAWLTAELQTLSPEDAAHYRDSTLLQGTLTTLLDNAAKRLYRKEAAQDL